MSKKLLVLFALVIMIVPLASVNAQSMVEGIDFCEIMDSDPDCQLLVDSTEAMATLGSFAFDMGLNYDIAMDGDMPQGMDNMSFGLSGNGMLAINMEAFSTLQDLAMTDMQAYMAQLPTLMDQIFSGIEGEAYLVVTLPDMMQAMVGTTELPLNLLAKDGQYVVDVKALEDALGEDPSGLEWAGIDLSGAFEVMLSDFDFSSMYTDEQLSSMMNFDAAAIGEAMTITRLADSEVNGVPTAVFEMTFDYGVMLDSMGLRDMLTEIYTDAGMSPAEIDGIVAMLEGISITVNQHIGLEDNYNYRVDISMDMAMDGEMMGASDLDSMTLGFDMWMEMSDFNAPVDIQLPENAMIMPFEMMMGAGA